MVSQKVLKNKRRQLLSLMVSREENIDLGKTSKKNGLFHFQFAQGLVMGCAFAIFLRDPTAIPVVIEHG